MNSTLFYRVYRNSYAKILYYSLLLFFILLLLKLFFVIAVSELFVRIYKRLDGNGCSLVPCWFILQTLEVWADSDRLPLSDAERWPALAFLCSPLFHWEPEPRLSLSSQCAFVQNYTSEHICERKAKTKTCFFLFCAIYCSGCNISSEWNSKAAQETSQESGSESLRHFWTQNLPSVMWVHLTVQ